MMFFRKVSCCVHIGDELRSHKKKKILKETEFVQEYLHYDTL